MTTQQVAVLGLGRMGSAMARRLSDQGWPVVGWHRSGKPIDGIAVEPDVAKAVRGADIALLSLVDDAACAEVLEQILEALREDTVVINTSTVSPDSAARFADELGAAYVHAPVLGSVPAAMTGALQVLAAGEHPDDVTAVLSALGTVHPASTPSAAAGLKLIANGTLAGVLSTVDDVLEQAAALALDRSAVLDVLELTAVGGLVKMKRGRLQTPDPHAPADFTVAGVVKDQALLARASGVPWRYARRTQETMDSGVVGPQDDMAALMLAPPVDTRVLAPLHAYVRGHATGDPVHLREAFLPTAHIEGIRDGAFVSWTLEEYVQFFPGRPAPDEATRSRRIDEVTVAGTIATATMTLDHGAHTFTDIFLLVRTDGGWRIANKLYHRN